MSTEYDSSQADDEEYNDHVDAHNTTFVTNSVTDVSVVKSGKPPTTAMLSVTIEGTRVNVIYDPGASCTVIPETLWLQLGAPALSASASPQLYAFTPTCRL